MVTTPQFIDGLRNELQQIDNTLKNVSQLRVRRDKIQSLIKDYGSGSGNWTGSGGGFQSNAAPAQTRQGQGRASRTASVAPSGRGRRARRAPQNAGRGTQHVSHRGARQGGQTTMDMVRAVLRKSNSEMFPNDIHTAIVNQFGQTPRPSLTQMLYKRSRAGNGFYRTDDGKYGVLKETAQATASGQ